MYLNNDLPRKGWQYIDTVELTTPTHTCQMCGKNEIRFIHIIYHPIIKQQIEVGKVCAERLTEDYVNPKEGEKRLKKMIRWIQSSWKISAKGNVYKKHDGCNMVIYKHNSGKYKCLFKWSYGDLWDENQFETIDKAKENFYKFFNQKA